MPPTPIEDKHSPALIRRVRTILAEPESHAWRDIAACRKMGPDLFFAERGEATKFRAAKAICVGCPVAVECLADAIRTGELHGIRGGLGERSRQEVARLAGVFRPQPALKPCGTVAAYQRHYRNGEKPCDACRKAYAVAELDWRTPQRCLDCNRGYRSRSSERGYCSAACRMRARAKGTAA